MRYYFDFSTDRETAKNDTGLDLSDPEQAKDEGRKGLADVVTDEICDGMHHASLSIRDENGDRVFKADLEIAEDAPEVEPGTE